MNVLVTGATGFVGKNLTQYLLSSKELKVSPLNLRDKNFKLADADIVIHLAGKAHDLKKHANSDEYYQINYELTKRLYNDFLESSASKFIFISSVKAVADSVEGTLSEDTIPDPLTDYGKSKLMAEDYIKQQSLPAGKSFYILRPCMIHGPGNKGNLNLLYKFITKGLPYPLAAFENKRSFLSVDNLCFIIKELIKRKDIPQGIYNVADDTALSSNDLVILLSQSLNRTPRLWRISKGTIGFLAKIGDILRLPINSERVGKLTENYRVSNQKILNALNKNLPLSSAEGIIKTAEEFNTNHL